MVLTYPVVPHLLSCDLFGRSYKQFSAIGFWRGGAEGGVLGPANFKGRGAQENVGILS